MENQQNAQARSCAKTRCAGGLRRWSASCKSNAYLKAVIAVAATVLAAFAISYLAHLDKTSAYAAGGLLSTLSAICKNCSLQDALVAVPFGVLIWLRTPPPKIQARP